MASVIVDGDLAAGDPDPQRPGLSPRCRSAATAAATVPVPHERVSPTPRSCTRMVTPPVDGRGQHLDVDPLGKLRGVERHRRCDVESGQVRRRSATRRRRRGAGCRRRRRCPPKRRPPTIADPVPNWLALPMSTVTSADGRIDRRAARPAGGRPASRRRTRRAARARWPAGSARTPGRRCRTSARSSRRRCGSPCTSRRARRRRGSGRTRPPPAPHRPSSPAARRRHRGPGGGRTARPPRPGVSASRAVDVGQQHEVVLRTVPLGELHLFRIRRRHILDARVVDVAAAPRRRAS